MKKDGHHEVALVNFVNSKDSKPLEMKIGFSLLVLRMRKMNFEHEMLHKDFAQVACEADEVWGKAFCLKYKCHGGTERAKKLNFILACIMLLKWPALRSDVKF